MKTNIDIMVSKKDKDFSICFGRYVSIGLPFTELKDLCRSHKLVFKGKSKYHNYILISK